MKKNVKKSIMETAQYLFNDKGYNEVSMRDIADSLGISVGNLTYHFKKKEDLIEAVIIQQHTHYKKYPAPGNLEELHAFFQHLVTHQERNTYYFRHYTQLAQLCPSVYRIQLGAVKDLFDTLTESFELLNKKKLLASEELTDQYVYTVRSIMMICIFGSSSFELEKENNKTDRIKCLWSLIFPLLTSEGKKICRKLLIFK